MPERARASAAAPPTPPSPNRATLAPDRAFRESSPNSRAVRESQVSCCKGEPSFR